MSICVEVNFVLCVTSQGLASKRISSTLTIILLVFNFVEIHFIFKTPNRNQYSRIDLLILSIENSSRNMILIPELLSFRLVPRC